MTSLQGPGSQNNPDPFADLVAMQQRMRQDISEATASVLRSAGVRTRPGRITSDDFDGVDHDDLGTAGWSLGADEVGGSSYLALNGIDVYEALQSQITTLAAQQAELTAQQAALAALVNDQVTFAIAPTSTFSGWASSTGHDTKASASIPVPAGYTRGLVFALASMHFMDSAPNGGWVRAVIAGVAGDEMGGLANLQLGQSASHTISLTGLSGSPITIQCQMRSSVATGAMSGRIAQISGFGLFLR